MQLKSNLVSLTLSPQTLLAPTSGQQAVIHSLMFWNATASPVLVTLTRFIQASGNTFTMTATVPVSGSGPYVWPLPIDMQAGDTVQAAAATSGAVTADCNFYLDTGGTPIATGFTPRGTWSSSATYNPNDVVASGGASYLCITANTNSVPPNANWMVLSSATTFAGTGTGTALTASMTGNLSAPAISAGTLTLNLNTANSFKVALNATVTTFTLSNPPASVTDYSFTLIFTADGTPRTVTWFSTITWVNTLGNQPPVLTSINGKRDRFVFLTVDGGSTWEGYVIAQGF